MPLNRLPEYTFTKPRVPYPPRHKSVYGMAIIFLFILCSGYIFFQSSAIFFVPELTVSEPSNGAHLKDSIVAIKGITTAKTLVTINGFEVYSDDAGAFDVTLPFQQGFQVIDIRVKNKVGREARIVRQVVVQ